MNTSSFHSIRALVVALSVLGAAAANAVPLAPGDTVALPGTTVAADPQLAGTIIEDEIIDFGFATSTGQILARIQSRVVRSDLDNTLDFYWRVVNFSDSDGGSIGSFRIGDFDASSFDADWRIDGVGALAPTSAHRFTGLFDDYLNFNFGQALGAGVSSKFMFLDTDALDYAKTALMDVANVGQTSISASFLTWEPVARVVQVPEPASLGMMALGLIGIAGVRRRRSR